MRYFKKTNFFLLVLLILSACATQPGQTQLSSRTLFYPDESLVDVDKLYWWSARFKINWPANINWDSAMDLFVAHRIVAPSLEKYSNRLFRWRFHRRAARDNTGHQFSFIFYADADIAEKIFNQIRSNAVLNELLNSQLINNASMGETDKPSKPDIEDSSDSNWSETLQRQWPAYIMGVSAMWLGLIDENLETTQNEEVFRLLEAYRRTEEKITSIWYQEGKHALLHHLNAIFGYRPLLLEKEIRF